MANPFVAEIRILACNFAPKGWAFCDGQLLPISQNTALFSLLGTTYGGNGQSTFALPDLQGRAPLHKGQGPGLSLRDLGEQGGSDAVTLLQTEMPAHTHAVSGRSSVGQDVSPQNDVWSTPGAARGLNMYNQNPGGAPQMNPGAFSNSGGSLPHNNLPPYLTLNFCIALQGVFPPRG
ncbi:MAG: phage tail protein [Ignavibacteria bacterium]|nr:MAG: phage tail protein [Ignavibacteria bacterium]